MFKTVDELKEFVIWARSQKVKQIKVDNIEVVMSDMAFIEDLTGLPSQTLAAPKAETPNIADPLNGPPLDDPDLFYSVR
jgi:hypothetical protein